MIEYHFGKKGGIYMFDANELVALSIIEALEREQQEKEKEMQKEADREEENEMYNY